MFDMPTVSRTATNNGGGVAPKSIVQGAENADSGENATRGNLIALFLVLSYIGVGILFYHFVEKWPVVDCVYFAMVIITTVGYGDVIPLSETGKAFTIFFAFYGICTIGMALGRLARLFLERQKGIAKEATQMLLSNVDSASAAANAQHAVVNPVSEKEQSLAVPVSSSLSKKKNKRSQRRASKWWRAIFSDSNKAILNALVPIAISIGGGLIVGAIEGWPVLDCFYYSIITITTVGFGDLSPKSQAARIFAIFYLPLAVVSVAHGIGSVVEELSKRSVMRSVREVVTFAFYIDSMW